MADLDEKPCAPLDDDDLTPAPLDLDDETQDFRFLSSLSTTSTHPTLPRRGAKDFEPHGTNAQVSQLESARGAMHDALSQVRYHTEKNLIGGHYVGRLTGGETEEEEGEAGNRVEDMGASTGRKADERKGRKDAKDKWAHERETVVEKARGQHFRTLGLGDSAGRVWLLPEEALWLLERGALSIQYRVRHPETPKQRSEDEEKEGGDRGYEGMPMSLQAAYSIYIGGWLTLEKWTVYAGLRRLGYIVSRYEPASPPPPQLAVPTALTEEGGWKWLWRRLFEGKVRESGPLGPLVGVGLYRSYNEIYRRLSVIPFHDPTLPSTIPSPTSAPPTRNDPTILLPTFTLHKPHSTFRKSSPPPPDLYIHVLAASSPLPTLPQISSLLNATPYDPPPVNMRNASQRLKWGYRNVVLAIVEGGVVSYIRVGDAAFGRERVEVSRGGRGGKGGGRGRGRGRGR